MSARERSALVRSVSRYDLVLAVIPLAFLLSGLAGVALSVPPHLWLAGGSVVGALAVADALFRNPPRGATP